MLSKLLDKCWELVVGAALARRWGPPALLCVFALVLAGGGVHALDSVPGIRTTLANPVFHIACIWIIGAFCAWSVWQAAGLARPRRIAAIAFLAVVAAVLTAWIAWTRIVETDTPAVVVQFDDSIDVTPEALQKLSVALGGRPFRPLIADASFMVGAPQGESVHAHQVRSAFSTAARPAPKGAITVLVTARPLGNDKWTGLLSVTNTEGTVLSTAPLGPLPLEDLRVVRYVAPPFSPKAPTCLQSAKTRRCCRSARPEPSRAACSTSTGPFKPT